MIITSAMMTMTQITMILRYMIDKMPRIMVVVRSKNQEQERDEEEKNEKKPE